MRKIVLSVAVSLDGFIEGPKGEYDWCAPDRNFDFKAFFQRFDAVFVGRKTYEMSLGMEGGPAGFPKFKEYVFSTTLEKVKEGSVLIRGDVKSEVERIKQEKGKDIWLFGGAGLTTSLMSLGLIDEILLAVYPIILGAGKPLFSGIKERVNLTLMEEKKYSSGLVSLGYSIAKG